MEPQSHQPSSIATLRLRHLAHQLFISLPRLVTLVRMLRTQSTKDAGVAMKLAQSLLKLKDDKSENELLHLVVVQKTKHPADAYIIPVSFRFKAYSDFEAAAYYWQTRLFLYRLCFQIQQVSHCDVESASETTTAESARLATNLLMSWEYAFGLGAFGTSRGGHGTMAFVLSNIAIWGFLTDVDTFRGHKSATVQRWVMQRMQDLLGGVKVVSKLQMKEMADLLAGGPIVGLIPRMVAGL